MKTALINWKTTILGILFAIGKYLDAYDPTHTTIAWHIGQILMILCAAGVGVVALDANQTAVNAGTTRAVVRILIIGFMIFATLQFYTACGGTFGFTYIDPKTGQSVGGTFKLPEAKQYSKDAPSKPKATPIPKE